MNFKSNLFKAGIAVVFGLILLSVLSAKAQTQERDSIAKNLDMSKYVFQDAEGHTVSIKDLKGKYVFLDIWASWCRPCINEFPFFDAMKADFKDKKIVFVQISCDQVERRWKTSMGFTNRKASDYQWFINGSKDFMKDLRISSIPRYLLIDRKGKLIDPYMTRASDAETKVTLSKLKGV